ncbi:hypothetical protein HYPSUDRAFT_150271, partial [Hypholoma sublateritium FD-334 SS-4]
GARYRMSDTKRKSQAGDDRRKKKYRSDGTPIWGKRHVEGPGVWVSCVKGKEKQAVGEVYELFESIALDIWPVDSVEGKDTDGEDEDTGLSLEEQVAKELSDMKRPRRGNPQQPNCQTNTPCVIFISCKAPVDPVELVVKYIKSVEGTGVSRTRYIQRLVPVSGTCVANPSEIQPLCDKIFKDFFEKHPDTKFTYKIELRVRNHNTIPRPMLIQTIAQSVPDGHTVDLSNPKIFILVEVFKSICGISIVEDYYRLQKFNVAEIVSRKNRTDGPEAGRLSSSATAKESQPAKSDETKEIAEEIKTEGSDDGSKPESAEHHTKAESPGEQVSGKANGATILTDRHFLLALPALPDGSTDVNLSPSHRQE